MHSLVAQLTDTFRQHANPSKAVEMESYLKNHFPFFGIQAPTRRALHKDWIKRTNELANTSEQRWELVQAMWVQEEREYHHTCIDWIQTWKKKDWKVSDGAHLTWLLTNNSWWDSVDTIAGYFVGNYCKLFPKEGAQLIHSYRASSDMWLNRTAILYQLKYKKETNLNLLEEICEQFEPNKEFFIQKAIGWSLRETGKTFPNEVKMIVERLNLSGLARREALRRLV